MRALVRLFSIAIVVLLCASCGGSQPADTSTTSGAGPQTRGVPSKAMEKARERAAEKEQQEETQEETQEN